MNAIPTRYNGIQFRSRLEAKWAAFFDLLEWQYEYEPIDLDGYIPDFILTSFKQPLLVEVKPVLQFNEFIQYADKLERCGWKKEMLIVGATIAFNLRYTTFHAIPIGLLAEMGGTWGSECFWDSGCLFWCNNWHYGLIHDTASFHCRVCGLYNGGALPGEELSKVYVRNEWCKAGNEVQWQAGQ